MKQGFFIFLALQLSFILTADKAITIFIAGDSTAAERDTSNNNPERGWGANAPRLFQQKFCCS